MSLQQPLSPAVSSRLQLSPSHHGNAKLAWLKSGFISAPHLEAKSRKLVICTQISSECFQQLVCRVLKKLEAVEKTERLQGFHSDGRTGKQSDPQLFEVIPPQA